MPNRPDYRTSGKYDTNMGIGWVMMIIIMVVGLITLGILLSQSARAKASSTSISSVSHQTDSAYMQPYLIKYNYILECINDGDGSVDNSYYGSIEEHAKISENGQRSWLMKTSVYDRFGNVVHHYADIVTLTSNDDCRIRYGFDEQTKLLNPR